MHILPHLYLSRMGKKKTMTTTILAINPGATSTKVALFQDREPVFLETLRHPREELDALATIEEQYHHRSRLVRQVLAAQEANLETLDAVVGRGGLLRPLPGGVYQINQAMLDDLQEGRVQVQHPANLGALIAHDVAEPLGVPSFIVDPPCVDEMMPEARVSGFPGIERRSLTHALNIKAVARRAAEEMGRPYDSLRLIVAHLGSGNSVTAHLNGRMVDLNDSSSEGPFSTQRAGGVPSRALAKICYAGQYTAEEMQAKLMRGTGLTGYLGTDDLRDVEGMIDAGDEQAALLYRAMIYQIAKEIAALSVPLEGRVDAIVVSGGLAHSERFIGTLEASITWLAPLLVFPGEDEMAAMAVGVLRALRGEIEILTYSS